MKDGEIINTVEPIPGKDLKAILASKILNVGEIDILLQIIAGLEYLHDSFEYYGAFVLEPDEQSQGFLSW